LTARPKRRSAVSFVVDCETQAEIDRYWDRLTEGGDEKAQVCGWLKDKYGVSWQIVPPALSELLSDPDPGEAGLEGDAADEEGQLGSLAAGG
jgi:predicted 3-demethylubiquinone-9 3-methyltransferase (glyoxalase superfamily)